MNQLTLPWPPSTNALWRSVRGRNIKSKRYREWQAEAGAVLLTQSPLPRVKPPVQITMLLLPPDRRKRDIDNIAKPVLDLLVAHGVIMADDTSVVQRLDIVLGAEREGIVKVWVQSLGAKPPDL